MNVVRPTRRQVLAGAGTLLGTGLAGCSSVNGSQRPVSILSAGSLHDALVNGLAPAVDQTVHVESHGSNAVARFVSSGQKDPDVVSVADVALFDDPLHPAWYAEFATNSVVVAYDADTAGGRRVRDAGTAHWYEALQRDDVRVGRTDPDLDPLGYRTLFVLELATDYYDTSQNLRETIPASAHTYPETQLIGKFETGAIDAAVVYRNMAVERGYDYVDLPPQVDLSDPAYADRYERATYTLQSGKTVRGGLISYGTTVRHDHDGVHAVFDEQITGDYLDAYGFVVPDSYPQVHGTAPSWVS